MPQQQQCPPAVLVVHFMGCIIKFPEWESHNRSSRSHKSMARKKDMVTGVFAADWSIALVLAGDEDEDAGGCKP